MISYKSVMNRKNAKRFLTISLFAITIAVVVFGVIYGAFQLKKKFTYAVFYKSQVEQTVRDMVKEECLRQSEGQK